MSDHSIDSDNYNDAVERLLELLLSEDSNSAETDRLIDLLLLSREHEAGVSRVLAKIWDECRSSEYSEESKLEGAWVTLEGILRKCPDFPAKPKVFRPAPKPLYKRTLFRVAAVVLPVLLLAGATFFTVGRINDIKRGGHVAAVRSPVGMITITAGDNKEVSLPDGTTVHLKRGAELIYAGDFPVASSNNGTVNISTDHTTGRRVTLKGDAFFRVSRDEERPFEVSHNDMTIRVLGTEFYVTDYGPTTEITLRSGAVEVCKPSHTVQLSPGHQYRSDAGSCEYSMCTLSEAELAQLSHRGLRLNSIALDKALLKTADYFGVRIELTALSYRGNIRLSIDERDTLDDVLFMLRTVSGCAFDYHISNGTVSITGR